MIRSSLESDLQTVNFLQWSSFRSFLVFNSWRKLLRQLPLFLLVKLAVSYFLQIEVPINLLFCYEWHRTVTKENFCEDILPFTVLFILNKNLCGVLFWAYFDGLCCRSALRAFKHRVLYANVSYDRILFSMSLNWPKMSPCWLI